MGDRCSPPIASSCPPPQDEALKLDAAYIEKIAVTHSPAAANLSAKQPVASVSLPRTATDARLYIGVGALLLIANVWLIVLAWRREKRGVGGVLMHADAGGIDHLDIAAASL